MCLCIHVCQGFCCAKSLVVCSEVTAVSLRILGGNDTMDLYTLTRPYAAADKTEFDPNLGKHDAFLLLGPYIFAQVSNS